jgi:signal transduction histidine kinase
MTASADSDSRGETSQAPWIPWRACIGIDLAAGDPWIARLQLQSFRLLAALAVASLVIIAGRGILAGYGYPWADLANAAIFALFFVLSFVRPRWIRLLCWLGLLSLFLNAIDGLEFAGVVPHSLILLPLLVLYGALLGDFWISLAALTGVAAMYAYTWIRLEHLARREVFILTDACLLALFSGIAALSIWLRHRRLEKELVLQAAALREELDLRSRLQAIIAHDIRNPLTVLLNAANIDDPRTIQAMVRRIAAIVDAAGNLASGQALQLSLVTAAEIGIHLNEVFATRLAQKGQTLTVAAAPNLVLATDLPILCNSVLGNILGNAIKFSPRGTTIALTAGREDNRIRFTITDQGPGFPFQVLKGGPKRGHYRSQPGTEGERGTGSGLPIAALCAERLGGSIEIRNDDREGAAVSVLLPCPQNPAGSFPVIKGAPH